MKTSRNLIISFIIFAVASAVAHAGYLGASTGYIVDGGGDKILAVQSGTTGAEGRLGSQGFELELIYFEESEALSETVDGLSIVGDGDFQIIPLMANYYLRSKASRDLTFYGGGGLGYSFYEISANARVSGTNVSISDSGGAFTWQMMFGVQYAFSPTTSLKIGYRYLAFEDLSILFEDAVIDGQNYLIDEVDYKASGGDSILELGLMFKW